MQIACPLTQEKLNLLFRPSGHKINIRLTLKLNQKKLFESSKIKYFGLILDNKLNWKPHITELCKKLGGAVGMLYKIRTLCPASTLKSLYFSLFHSHLSYGLVVWVMQARLTSRKSNLFRKKHLQP